MIVVITNKEVDEKTGHSKEIVSHGIDVNTGKIVNFPPVPPPKDVGAIFDTNLMGWVLYDEDDV